MNFSKTIKITQLFILFIILIFLWIYHNQHWTHLSLAAREKHPCSFDNIAACQISNPTHRTFLYITWGGAGFCSEMNQILLAFAYSVMTKRQCLIDSRSWNYGNFADYFHHPISNYDRQVNHTFLVKDNRENEMYDHLKTTRVGAQIQKFWLATRDVQLMAPKRHAAHYLWKSMTTETLKFIEKHRIKSLSNYIGIHIRRGDKLKAEAHDTPYKKYITTIERIFQTNKTMHQIFVASDDYTIVDRFRQLKPTWKFFSLHDHNHQRANITGHFQSRFNRVSASDNLNKTRLFMSELQMLVDAEYVLCGMSSNVCRLIQVLRYQDPSTAISVDRPWYAF